MRQIHTAALALLLASTCTAVHAEDFYAQNDITIVDGFAPGGSSDAYARLLARHMSQYIPGNPNITVQNMPGAGSLTAVRHLDTTAPTDGTVIVIFNPGLVLSSLVDPETIAVDFRDYGWVGSVTQALRVCYTFTHSGITGWDDLVAGSEFIIGATSPGTGGYIDASVLQNVFDLNIQLVTGFPGSAEINFALERGEVDGQCGNWSSVSETWKAGDDLVPLVRLADIVDPSLSDDIPFLGELAETDEQREVFDVVSAGYIIGAPFIVSAQVPEERLAILREAFDATVQDPAFIAESEGRAYPVVGPLTGPEAEAMLANIYSSDPELVSRIRSAVGMD